MENIDQNLLTYFVYIKSVELDPEKYGNLSSVEEWGTTIKNNQKDIDLILSEAKKVTSSEWDRLNTEYKNIQNKTVEVAKKGTSIKKRKKCSCGCDLLISRETGGKLVSKCACNCKGGKMNK